MNNTIITGAVAFALAAPAFAGETAPYVAPEAAPTLGFSGDLSLGYQSDFEFRGRTLDTKTYWGEKVSTETVTADLNVAYAFNDNWSAVSGYRLDSVSDSYYGDFEQSYIGAVWSNDCWSAELGFRYIDGFSYSTQELYLDLGTVCPWTGAKLNLLWAHDIDETKGDYFQLSAVKSFELNDWASIELGAGISYSVEYWNADSYTYAKTGNKSDWNHWYLGAALPLKATETVTVTPYVRYNDGLGALEFGGNGTPSSYSAGDEFVWGIKAAVKF
jgi:hypothetical protein